MTAEKMADVEGQPGPAAQMEVGEEKHNVLKKVATLGIDTDDNLYAVKGDDSDGQINWTWRQIVASLSLAGLYVGACVAMLLPVRRQET